MSQILRIPKSAIAGLVALFMALSVIAWLSATDPEIPEERHKLALMTSLPVYWPEGSDIASLVDTDSENPWVRETLERRYEITPLDSLTGNEGESAPIEGLDRLIIAQPRGLSPADNEGLDTWVREGGKLLYFLDPMLTGHYSVALSDPSHPTAVGLIPPVVLRWGMTLRFDDFQPFELREADYGQGTVPVQVAGEVILLEEIEGLSEEQLAARGSCAVLGDGIAAKCSVGAGQVFLLADAAILEMPEAEGPAEEQLLALLEHAFEE
uniref:Gldg family protein n=1 Tax=uncultured Altererythrobacter sp. TaxID=500840 RepID=UPI002637AFE0|nr:hypothetical protein [uncultured Altererythrobacter sp.]